jgi:hypothetical protein
MQHLAYRQRPQVGHERPRKVSKFPPISGACFLDPGSRVSNIDSGPRLDRLKRMGLEYKYNRIARDWYLAKTPLESLALEQQNLNGGGRPFWK